MGRINAYRALRWLKDGHLYHYTNQGDPDDSSLVGTDSIRFYDVEPDIIPDNGSVWWSERWRVTKWVEFPHPEWGTPLVWGDGVATLGYSEGEGPWYYDDSLHEYRPADTIQYGMGWCGVIPNTITPEGCSLCTYVYYVDPPDGPPPDTCYPCIRCIGPMNCPYYHDGCCYCPHRATCPYYQFHYTAWIWCPCSPSDVRFSYTVFYPPQGVLPGLSQTKPSLSFRLKKPIPNPFSHIARIEYSIEKESHTRLNIYDAVGRLVRTLIDTEQKPGVYTVNWEGIDDKGRRVNSGVYFCRLEAGRYYATEKFLFIR